MEFGSVGPGEPVEAEEAFSIRFLLVSPTKIASQYSHLKDTTFVELSDKCVRTRIGEDFPEVHRLMEKEFGKHKEPHAVKIPLRWVLLGSSSAGHRVWKQVHPLSEKDDLKAPGIYQNVEEKEVRIVEKSSVLRDVVTKYHCRGERVKGILTIVV
ncbi:hypothetical protein CRM22_002203 [Opisthorchis felineus]|uniref:Uncharacterized protein n=1 Tax=Opisthorchis felineus TaxID=147828 RepID=A0A4S2M7B6_OPIFE|nr:hypothetical protein CRM22_002203 [Opisthorchis felineus]